jgi:hypothetical protein
VAETRSDMGVGFTTFAAVMMVVLGAFDALQGLAAVIRKHYFVTTGDYVYKFNVTTWGWIHLVLGVIVALAGVALLRGVLWARIVGVAVAAVIAISNFMWLPYYPVGSVVIIATCGFVIWALLWHGNEIAE